ncbi:MAG: hypothetical protein ACK4G3_06740, partial [bacterium]
SFPNFRVFDEEWNTLTPDDLPRGYFLIYLHSSRADSHPVNLVRAIRYLNKIHTKFPHIIGMVEGYTFGSLSHLKRKHHPAFPIYFLDVDAQLMEFFFPSDAHHSTFILWNPQKEEVLRTNDLVLIYLLLSEWAEIEDKATLLSLINRFQEQTRKNVTPPAFHTAERIGGYSSLLMHYLKYQIYYQVENWSATAENLRLLPPEVIYLLWEDFSRALEVTFFRLPSPFSDQELNSLRKLVEHLLSFEPADFQVTPELKPDFSSSPFFQNFLRSIMFASGLVALLQQRPAEAAEIFEKLQNNRRNRNAVEYYVYSRLLAGDIDFLQKQFLHDIASIIKHMASFPPSVRNERLLKLYFLERQYINASAPIPATFDFYLYLWLKYGAGEDISSASQERAKICIQKLPLCKHWLKLAESAE